MRTPTSSMTRRSGLRGILRGLGMALCLAPAALHAQPDAYGLSASSSSYKWLTVSQTTGLGALDNLPISTGANRYNKQVATRAQMVRRDDQGNILFFVVDGNVYDGDGYLIADAKGSGCQECVDPGIIDFISVPVPGSCSMFYLLSAAADDANHPARAMVSVLDLEADNVYHTGRKGAVLEIWESAFDDVFPYWNNMETEETGYSAALPVVKISAKSNSPIIRVVKSGSNAGDHSWLLLALRDYLYVYKITDTGIHPVTQPAFGKPYVELSQAPSPAGSREFVRDADVFRNGDEVSFAMVDSPVFEAYPYQTPIAPTGNLITLRLSNATGVLVNNSIAVRELLSGSNMGIDIPGPATGVGGLSGCAFGSDANTLWLSGQFKIGGNWVPRIGTVNVTTGAFTDRTSSVPSATNYVHSRLYRNRAPNGSSEAIYFPTATGVGALTGVLSPPVSVVFTANAIAAPAPKLSISGSSLFMPHFLNEGVHGENFLTHYASDDCCEFRATTGLHVVNGHEQHGYVVWSPASNPYGSTSTITFTDDLVVKAGVSMYINNMTLRFTSDARVIVERGGRLYLSNTWLSSIDCPGARWPGARVEGTTSNGNQTGSAQGQLRMTGGGISNAVVGAWTAREQPGGTAHPDYFGGVVRATTNAVFRNCITGVRIERYQRTSGTTILPNYSTFSSCTFETTSAWPDPGLSTPYAHAHLFDVQGIQFTHCTFINHAPGLFPLLQRGWGVFGFLAGFDVLGNTTPDASLFKDLSIGVAAATGTLRKANVRRTWFRGNQIGAYMQACTAPEVSRSHFFVPAATSPDNPTGLTLHQSTAYLVEENTFNGGGMAFGNIGIHFTGDVPAENSIYNNTFNGLNAGTYVMDRHKGNTPKTEYMGLQLLCGDYTDCGLDYLLGDNTYIKEAQGFWGGSGHPQNQLVGNRFFTGAVNGITITPTQPSSPSPFFNYIRHNVPECDPLNPSPYYSDIPIGPNVFNKAEDCGKGELTGHGGGGTSGYRLAAAQLQSAQSHFLGTVDGGDRRDILDAVRQDAPWLPSHVLRDQLLVRSPLSDEVLLAVIGRPEPMDPWHLAQVMLGNARPTPRVLRALEAGGLLNEYMLAIVQNAGGDGPTVKDLLRQEVELRAMQKARALTAAYGAIAADSLLASPHDSLYALLAEYPDPADHYLLAGMAMERGDRATATAWLDSLRTAGDNGHELLRDLVDLHAATGGDWGQADAAQRDQLAAMATSHLPGAAMAWAIRYHLGETREVPTAAIPAGTKSLMHTPAKAPRPAPRPLLEAHPNPTTGQSWLVVGTEVDEPALVRITDPQGRLVRSHRLAPNQRLLEVDLNGLSNGLYLCELRVGDLRLATAKLTLQR